MIHITGDTHGEQARFSCLTGESTWGKDDILLICGDFGYLFQNDERERDYLDLLEKKPYTICFCDGNHENFPAIFSYPEEIWHGGKIHRIRDNVIHLMRGQVFELEGKRWFSMGGAYSIDRYMRAEGVSFWKEELPSNDEYHEAVRNLAAVGNRVDYVITHTAPREIILRMGYTPDVHDAELTGFLEWVMYEVKFSRWFFGHWHLDREITEKMRALWFDVEDVE